MRLGPRAGDPGPASAAGPGGCQGVGNDSVPGPHVAAPELSVTQTQSHPSHDGAAAAESAAVRLARVGWGDRDGAAPAPAPQPSDICEEAKC
jgi:hypothetical protein